MSAVLNTATCGPAAWCRAEQVHENKDSATGEVEYFTTPRRPGLDSGSFFSERYVFVSFHTFMPQVSASLPYLLEVITYTPNWVEIDAGTSLTLTLDQIEQLPIAGNESCGKRLRNPAAAGDLKEEFALYPLSQDQLLRIGRAKTVAFRLVGNSQTITGSWNREIRNPYATFTFRDFETHPSAAEEYFRLEWKLAVDRSHLFMLKTSSAPIAPDRLKEPFHAL
jgi:hypothetical protein